MWHHRARTARKAYSLLVNAFHQSDRQDEAWASCQAGNRLFPDDKELLFRSAIMHHHFGRLREAEHMYVRVLEEPEERHFTSVDQGLSRYKARHNLALVYQEMGCLAKAEAQWLLVVQEVPAYRPGWRGLADVLLKQGRLPDAEKLASRQQSRVSFNTWSETRPDGV
jgi:tetratricopeptide (TPR) repeat protein